MVAIASAAPKSLFDAASIIVVKVGSALLVDEANNTINRTWLDGIAADIAELKAAGKAIVVVSSGAIALGSRALQIHQRKLKLQEKQAAAAAGQVTLAHAWMEALGKHEVQTAQILLSPDDTETRRNLAELTQVGCGPVNAAERVRGYV